MTPRPDARPPISAFLLLTLLAVTLGPAEGAQAADRAGDPVSWGVESLYGVETMNRTSGGDGVDVAVLDSGIDRDHPDLEGRLERCRNYTSPSIRSGDCHDASGHGTHVAGIVAADGGADGEGIWGVAPGADLWAFKVCRKDGQCATERIGDALRDATDLGADVAVMSLGGQREPFVQDALAYAAGEGVLVVAASGNEGPDLATIKYPAADRLAVGVGALGRVSPGQGHDLDNLAVPDFSSRGQDADRFRTRDELLEVSAPGLGVRSAAPGGGYTVSSGTSMAAPHVGGLAAVLWEAVGDADGDGFVADDVRAELRARAGDITRGTHTRTGYDPSAGVGFPRLTGPSARIDGPSGPVIVEENVTFRAQVEGPFPVATYRWDLDDDGIYEEEGQTVVTSFEERGEYDVHLQVTDDHGAQASANRTFRVHGRPTALVASEPPVPLAGAPVVLDGTRSWDYEGGQLVSYRWSGDGIEDREGPRIQTIFPDPGPRQVTLNVTDGFGISGETTETVLVNDEPQLEEVVGDLSVPVGVPHELSVRVTDEVGEITVTWHLPDGTNVTAHHLRHEFPLGISRVGVVARDEYGAQDEAFAIVTAEPPPGVRGRIPGPGLPALLLALAAGAAAVGRGRR